jgi:hypothetical protein
MLPSAKDKELVVFDRYAMHGVGEPGDEGSERSSLQKPPGLSRIPWRAHRSRVGAAMKGLAHKVTG